MASADFFIALYQPSPFAASRASGVIRRVTYTSSGVRSLLSILRPVNVSHVSPISSQNFRNSSCNFSGCTVSTRRNCSTWSMNGRRFSLNVSSAYVHGSSIASNRIAEALARSPIPIVTLPEIGPGAAPEMSKPPSKAAPNIFDCNRSTASANNPLLA